MSIVLDGPPLAAQGRTLAAAKVLIELQAWLDDYCPKAAELGGLQGMSTSAEVQDIARQVLALEDAGATVIIEPQENGPTVVRAATEAEREMIRRKDRD